MNKESGKGRISVSGTYINTNMLVYLSLMNFTYRSENLARVYVRASNAVARYVQ